METVFNDTSMGKLKSGQVYNLGQLVDAKKFVNESSQALLLRNALMCWFENSPLPDTHEEYSRWEANFRQNYFWKQLQYKEELTKKLNFINQFGRLPTKEQLNEMRKRIDDLANDHTTATESEQRKKQELIARLREEFAALKKKVTLDSYLSTKADI